MMSYFDGYFNINGYKSLRSYSAPVNLRKFDKLSWRSTEDSLDSIEAFLYRSRHYPLVTKAMERKLAMAEPIVMRACFLDSNRKGLYQPK